MDERVVTASAVISFVENLEDSSAAFYEQLAARFEEQGTKFSAFAKESKKIRVSVVRTYRETITDMLEACFSFEGMNLGGYVVDTTLAEVAGQVEALELAIELEERAEAFYLEAAERSQSLLATIPRAFSRAAKKRAERKRKLQSILDEAK